MPTQTAQEPRTHALEVIRMNYAGSRRYFVDWRLLEIRDTATARPVKQFGSFEAMHFWLADHAVYLQ